MNKKFWDRRLDMEMLYDMAMGFIAGIVATDIYHYFVYSV